MNSKPINQNPERYSKEGEGWKVSASKDIKPLVFNFGKPPMDLIPVLKADGIIVDISEALLCSPTTLEIVKSMVNPHYDVSVNGSVTIKGKIVNIGKTIPIIKIDTTKLVGIGMGRDTANKKGGVGSITYIYDGDTTMGVPNGLINQLNYTLVDSIDRPGDTFSYWDWIRDGDKNYDFKQLKIDTAQEDGKFDKGKLKTFLTDLSERLKGLRGDFNSIRRTFMYGDTPNAKGALLIPVRDYSVKPEDDIVQHQVVEKDTSTIGVTQSITQTAASSSVTNLDTTKKELTNKIESTSTTLQQQLAAEQAKDSLQQQQIREDLQAQITRNDAYYREKYGKPETK